MNAARNKIVSCAFGRRLGQYWRFNIDKVPFFQVTAYPVRDFRAQPQLVLHLGTSKINRSIAQAHVFASTGVFVELERRRFRAIQDGQFLAQHFDHAGRHLRINRFIVSRPDSAFNANNELIAHLVSQRERFYRVRVINNLDNARVITDIEKNNTAMVTTTMNPATEGNRFTDM